MKVLPTLVKATRVRSIMFTQTGGSQLLTQYDVFSGLPHCFSPVALIVSGADELALL